MSGADQTGAPASCRGLSCTNKAQKSMAFTDGGEPSSWIGFPEGTHMKATVSLWDTGIHDEDPVETSERVFIEFDNGFVTDPTPDLPDDVSELVWGCES